MLFDTPLHLSRWLLATLGIHSTVYYPERLPITRNVLIVSNHRSLLDAPLLMAATDRPVRFACHHYMSQVPLLREFITSLGGFPLDAPGQRQKVFFQQAMHLLAEQQTIGVFPEGASPMVHASDPHEVGSFHRGFAHLALRAPVKQLAIIPVAISSHAESKTMVAPLKMFSLFDPSEPLFDQPGWHPAVIYHQVNVLIGNPIWVTDTDRQCYQGKQAGMLAKDLTHACHQEIASLLSHDCY